MTQTSTRKGGPYDDYYAPLYNQLWSKNPVWKSEVKFHIQTIGRLLEKGNKWLDVGCGTGHYLSKFQTTDRTGLDFSGAMLKEAKKVNPGVDFYEQSITDSNPALDHVFDLVTCTGQPWAYLSNYEEIENAVENLAKWTSKKGFCMLTPLDISDLAGIEFPKYYDLNDVPNDTSMIRGIWWTYKELDTVYHNMLLPNIDEWVRWFAEYFKRVEILHWPHEPAEMFQPRRALICSQKREIGDKTPVEIIEHSRPPKPGPTVSPLAYFSNKTILSEFVNRLKTGRFLKAAIDRILPRKRHRLSKTEH